MKSKKGCILSILLVLFIFGVTIPLFMTNHTKIKAEQLSNLSGSVWYLNSTFTGVPSGQTWDDLDDGHLTYNLDFTSNNTSYYTLYFGGPAWSPSGIAYLYPGIPNNQRSVWYNTWKADVYRTITINGGTDATNSNLINWLYNNGTLTSYTPPTPADIQITHRYWSPYGVITMSDNEEIGDTDIEYTIKFNEFTDNYDDTIQTGLKFLGVQTNDPNVQWSYIESINGPGINILYHGETNNINNAMWLEFTPGDYIDTSLYDFMTLWGHWFDDDKAYIVGMNQGYVEGKADGRALGQADGVEYTNLISNIFNGVGDLLSIQVFPNITIALIIGLPLLLGVLVIIIKLLRG